MANKQLQSCLAALLLLLLGAGICNGQDSGVVNIGGVFFLPPEPCTNETVMRDNYVWAAENQGSFSRVLEAGGRLGSLGGSGNVIGNDQSPIVNSLVFGYNGNVSYSNSVLFSYGQVGSSSKWNNEFRVHASNGAAFQQTELRAASLLVQDDPSERTNVTTLASYLSSQATTATATLVAINTYRYRWTAAFSPETRFRYGFDPTQAASVDSSLAPPSQTIDLEVAPPLIVNDTTEGVCQLENVGVLESTVTNGDDGSIDLGSWMAMVTRSIAELDARITALENA